MIETIITISCIMFGVAVIAACVCIRLEYKAKKREAEYYCEKYRECFEKLEHLSNLCASLNSEVTSCEDKVKAAYELGHKESKCSIEKQVASECYEKLREWHPVTKKDTYSYDNFIKLFEQWLKEKYDLEVKNG